MFAFVADDSLSFQSSGEPRGRRVVRNRLGQAVRVQRLDGDARVPVIPMRTESELTDALERRSWRVRERGLSEGAWPELERARQDGSYLAGTIALGNEVDDLGRALITNLAVVTGLLDRRRQYHAPVEDERQLLAGVGSRCIGEEPRPLGIEVHGDHRDGDAVGATCVLGRFQHVAVDERCVGAGLERGRLSADSPAKLATSRWLADRSSPV